MIGGDKAVVASLDPIFKALCPGIESADRTPGRTGEPVQAEYGYLHCGPVGSGHFVKMVHNGIEYGMMAAFAEGLAIFEAAEKISAELEARGISAIIDDRRGTSPGVKFKDAELIGIPMIVVVGKALEQGNVEVRVRKTGDKVEVAVASAVEEIAKTLATLP